MDEFEELYRKSPTAKVLYEKSGLFTNRSMNLYSRGGSGVTKFRRPAANHQKPDPRQSISLLEFEKPRVVLKKLTTTTCWQRYGNTSYLSPKAKLIQSMKESTDVFEEFKAPLKIIKVIQRTDNERRCNQMKKSPEENDKQQVMNHVTSKDIPEKDPTKDNSIVTMSSNQYIGDRGKQKTNAAQPSHESWENYENEGALTAKHIGHRDGRSGDKIASPSGDSLLKESVAKDLTSDLVAANMHDRAEVSPTSAELNRKYRMSKLLINLDKLLMKKPEERKESNTSADIQRQKGSVIPVSTSQCESDSVLEIDNCSDESDALARNLFELSASTTGEDSTGVRGNDSRPIFRQSKLTRDSNQVKGKVNNGKRKSKKEEKVSVGIPAEKNENVSEIEAEISTKKSSKKTTTVLTDWSLRAVGNSSGIYVEGHRPVDEDGVYWHSSAIVKRITATQLETGSGSIYKLTGAIDQQMSLEYGFSISLIKKFKYGFPRNWKEIMQVECERQCSVECKTPVESKAHGKSKTPVENKTTSEPKAPVIEAPLKVTPVSHGRERRKTTKKAYSTVSHMSQSTLSLKDLPSSSRGRLIKPPLAYWTGQRLRKHVGMDLVEIVPGTSNLIGVSESPTSLDLHEEVQVSNRELRTRRRNVNKNSKKPKGMNENTSDSDISSRDINVGSTSSATDSDAISKLQSRQLKKSMNRKDAVGKSIRLIIDTEESSQSEAEEINKAQRTSQAVAHKGTLKKPSVTWQSHGVFETPRCSRSVDSITPVETINNIEGSTLCQSKGLDVFETPRCSWSTVTNSAERIDNRSIDASSVTCSEYAEAGQSTSSDTPKSRPRRKSSRGKSNVIDENTITNQQATSNVSNSETELSCQEADDEQSDPDQRKKKNRKRISPRKQALLATVDSATNIQHSRENYNTEQEHFNKKYKIPVQEDEVVKVPEKNNVHIKEDKNTGSRRKSSRGKTVLNAKRDTPATNSNIANTMNNLKTRQQNKKDLLIEDCNSKSNTVWQPKEINKLQKTMKTVAPSTAGFWHKISMVVGTKTATECQDKYQAIRKRPSVKKDVKKDKVPVMLTAKHGTMKRKRQLRQLVEQYDEDYEDDLFDMLENQTSKKPKIPDDFVTDEDDSLSSNPGKFQTPTVRPLTRIPMSTQKTPHSGLISPRMFHSIDRKQIDPYIHRMQGKRRRALKSVKVMETKRRQSIDALHQVLNGHGANIFEVTALSDVDSEEEKDHYWSDEDFH